MAKVSHTFSIDEDLSEEIREREDLDPSPAVNKYLWEYVNTGRGPEAAYEIRREQLESELADLQSDFEEQKRRVERELDRIARKEERREERLESALDQAESKVRQGWAREHLHPDNEAIQNLAADAGVSAERFVRELEGRLS